MQLERISTPVRAVIDTTRRCNLNCWYCHSTSGPNYKGPEIDGSKTAEIFKAADSNLVFDITLTGGEPLLWKGLDEAMEASTELSFSALALITNATTVNKFNLRSLRKGNVQRINASIDGIGENHDRIRGPGSFERTIRGVQRLRETVDNITVITVLDNSNFANWEELTQMLVKLGVKQHHLAPVCYSGNARSQFQGLTSEQFAYVRARVDALRPSLPEDFLLEFGDTLVHGFHKRQQPINLFIEGFKGWQINIRPDGSVKGHTKAWGRNWRTNETLGNINDYKLSQILEGYSSKIGNKVRSRFSIEEEVARKFHIGNNIEEVKKRDDSDIAENSDESHREIYNTVTATGSNMGNSEAKQLTDAMNISTNLGFAREIAAKLLKERDRYRFRTEDGFAFLFDRLSFDIFVLTKDEQDLITRLLN